MVLVPRWVVFLLVSLVVLSIAGIGIAAYRVLLAASNTVAAEQLLYAAICSGGFFILALVGLIGRTRFISRELDKLIELSRKGEFNPELSMRKLGAIGEKITLLYFRLNALNEKRSLKISAFSDLVQLLMSNIDIPAFVTDVSGVVLYVSGDGAARMGVNRSEILHRNVADLLPSIKLQEIVMRLDRSNATLKFTAGEHAHSLVPVNDRMKDLSYIVWVLDSDKFLTDRTKKPETAVSSSRTAALIRRVFARGYQHKES